MEKKKENKGEWIYATVACFGLGGAMSFPWNVGLYAGGIFMAGVRFLDRTTKFEKVFKEMKLHNPSELYPKELSKRKTRYGYDIRFSIPTGLALKDFETKHDAIEAYFKHRIVMEYDNGKNLLMRIYEQELKKKYDFKLFDCKRILEFPIGMTYGDEVVFVDLEEAPHIMIGGSNGAGKSVILNGISTNLCLKPVELVEIYIIDFKGNEFNDFKDLEHVKVIATEMKDAEKTLTWLKNEMENRYKVFAEIGAKKLSDYNKKANIKMPYKVLIIDEYADFVGKDGEYSRSIIQRLSQKARAAGIHMILSTQRDDSTVINGFVKNNINTIIGLTCGNRASSQVVIDEGGLENLTKNGHFIIKHRGDKVEGRAMYIDSDDIREALKDIPRKKQAVEVKPKPTVNLKVLDRL